MESGGRRLIAGMNPAVFAIVFVVVMGGVYLEILPNNMLIGFVIPMVIGGLFIWLGEKIPVFRTFGGPSLLCIIVPAVFVYWGLFPQSGVEIVADFYNGYGFIDLFIAALIVGSLLSMDRQILVKAGIRFFIPLLAGVVLTFVVGGLVGHVTGFGYKEAILFVIAPIMGGGIGAGAVPMSEIYASGAGGDPAEYLSMLVPAIMVANVLCIFVASILNGLGKKNKNMFIKGFSGEGEILRNAKKNEAAEPLRAAESKETTTYSNLAVGLMMSGALYIFGYFIAMLFPSIHAYAWMIIATALVKILNITPTVIEDAAGDWFDFVSKMLLPCMLVATSIGLIDMHQIIEVVTNPAYLGLTALTVLLASFGAGIFGWLVAMYFVESAIAAGLCMADVGGSGDAAVLGASERLKLMPFSQISSRLGGVIILLIMSILAPLFL
ncbi:2-hydroxycarboxylate transporter family protein [Alkalihalobacillus oceani]|uniref:2-hydroxycarboxylate transporter family protein n=1 Tax=Halalkalibacter oceani TaxID=1653776 RepID=A0A9X2DVL3_9BACI|nr:2-hydroxycarboxylate transporter family protein [Halalkalibacter oceani]MCM3716215.1 2-hydroxycarboxylate transporter family protein [Halalkalibacter oceani]